jgi:hypothetical protein
MGKRTPSPKRLVRRVLMKVEPSFNSSNYECCDVAIFEVVNATTFTTRKLGFLNWQI